MHSNLERVKRRVEDLMRIAARAEQLEGKRGKLHISFEAVADLGKMADVATTNLVATAPANEADPVELKIDAFVDLCRKAVDRQSRSLLVAIGETHAEILRSGDSIDTARHAEE